MTTDLAIIKIMIPFTGVVREAENSTGIPSLFAKAYDKDLLFDDLLGTFINFLVLDRAEPMSGG